MGPFPVWYWLVVVVLAGMAAGGVLLWSSARWKRGRAQMPQGQGAPDYFRLPGMICLAIAGLGGLALLASIAVE